MITFTSKGDFKNARKLLNKKVDRQIRGILEKYGEMGVEILKEATPKKTGKTADSWSYSIKYDHNGVSIEWSNSNVVKGQVIVILLDEGHGTNSGTYVRGRHFIEPTVRPLFDEMAEMIWKEVTS